MLLKKYITILDTKICSSGFYSLRDDEDFRKDVESYVFWDLVGIFRQLLHPTNYTNKFLLYIVVTTEQGFYQN